MVAGTGPTSVRLTGLDAIRGLAALSVLAYHALLTVPVLAESRPGEDGVVADWVWLVSHTPLRALWAGGGGRDAVLRPQRVRAHGRRKAP